MEPVSRAPARSALPPLHIGLTGGIGSGKSSAAAALVRAGAFLIDTDAIARELTVAGGAAVLTLHAAFGDSVITSDGALDRARMRGLAFADAAARARLESILHPMISERVRELSQAKQGADCIVFDVPLLAESAKWRARVHRVLVIDCESETQIARVALRPGWTREAAASVVAAQARREQRRAAADAVIFNEGIAIAALGRQAAALLELWRGLPRNPVEQ